MGWILHHQTESPAGRFPRRARSHCRIARTVGLEVVRRFATGGCWKMDGTCSRQPQRVIEAEWHSNRKLCFICYGQDGGPCVSRSGFHVSHDAQGSAGFVCPGKRCSRYSVWIRYEAASRAAAVWRRAVWQATSLGSISICNAPEEASPVTGGFSNGIRQNIKTSNSGTRFAGSRVFWMWSCEAPDIWTGSRRGWKFIVWLGGTGFERIPATTMTWNRTW